MSEVTGTISFSKQVLPILESNCDMNGCHDGASRHKALTNYQNVSSNIVSGNPFASNLYQYIVGSNGSSRMPPSGKFLSESQTQLIFLWITQGAPNN